MTQFTIESTKMARTAFPHFLNLGQLWTVKLCVYTSLEIRDIPKSKGCLRELNLVYYSCNMSLCPGVALDRHGLWNEIIKEICFDNNDNRQASITVTHSSVRCKIVLGWMFVVRTVVKKDAKPKIHDTPVNVLKMEVCIFSSNMEHPHSHILQF